MPLKVFGKAKKAPSIQESVQKLSETLLLLEKREDYLQKKVQTELQTAKANATTNKKVALMALKRKKQYQSQIDKLSGARFTIEQQMMAIQNAQVSLEAMNAMKMGARTMKVIHNHMTVDQVDDTMDEIREQMEVANEISDAISQPLGGELFDDDELEQELAELEEETVSEQFLTVKTPPAKAPTQVVKNPLDSLKLPAVPTGALDDDDELAALEREMAF